MKVIKRWIAVILMLSLACSACIAEGNGPVSGEEPAAELPGPGRPVTIEFSSFDGGGHEYTVSIGNPSIAEWQSERDYGEAETEILDGAAYVLRITITGLQEGFTDMTVYGVSPIMDNDTTVYQIAVDSALNVTVTSRRMLSTFFLYRSGDILYDTWRITLERDGYHASVNDGAEQMIGAETADALLQVAEAYNLSAWDGFSESATGVPDGESFWLEIRFTDGAAVLARGDNVYPEHYFDAMSEIREILENAVITPIADPPAGD